MWREAPMNYRIKVLIVDDHAVVRQGLLALINTAKDMVIVGEAENGITAVQQARDLHPDIIVMDLVMPDMEGIGAIETIKQESQQARILVLTNFGDEQHVLAALGAGAQGYLLKDAILTDVVNAIRDVHAGKYTLHPSVTHILMQAMQKQQKKQQKSGVPIDFPLTVREQDVLKLIAKGLTNQSIADSLHIDESTVRIHVSHILQKLNLDNRTQAALYALRHDLVSLNE
jgi:DNA-binding NarL/FixJ family response regulator